MNSYKAFLSIVSVATLLLCAVRASQISSVHLPIPLSMADSVRSLSSSAAITSALKQSNVTLNDDGACGVCVNAVTTYIVGAYIDAIKYACAHARTAKEVADCRWIAAHPEIFLGALVEDVKPVKSAVFYCLGASYCGNSDEAYAALTPSGSTAGSDAANIALQLEQNGYSLLTDDVLTTSPVNADTTSITQAKYTDGFVTVGDNNVTCAQCVVFWVEAQIVAALHDIATFCQSHSSDPKIAVKCQWIANHVPFVVGVLLARIQPIKFAAGICIGAQYCGNTDNQQKVMHNFAK